MNKLYCVLTAIILLLGLLLTASAQTDTIPAAQAPSDNLSKRPVEPIAYTAEATSTNIQTLFDGNRIIKITKELIFKDIQGRLRRETESVFNNQTQKTINIRDTVAGFEYYLNPLTKMAYRTPIKIYTAGTQKVTTLPRSLSTVSNSLGEKIIEGFTARGERSVTVIVAGAFGNEKQMEIISENWFAPELRALILSKRNDPQTGEYTYEMKNIKRVEPAAALFVVPEDYKIVDQGSPSDRYFIVEVPQ